MENTTQIRQQVRTELEMLRNRVAELESLRPERGQGEVRRGNLRSIVEDTPALICRFLPDGTLTLVNDRYCRYFNRKREELVGQNFFQFIPEEDRAKVRDHFMSLSKDRSMTTYEHKVIAPDGSIRWQQWTDRALIDKTGNVKEYQSIGIDITDRKRAEDALRASEERYRDLVENSIVGVYKTNVQGDILYANSALAEIFEFESLEEMKAEGVLVRYKNPRDREFLLDSIGSTAKTQDFEFEVLTKKGKTKVVLLSGTFQGGSIHGMIVDITERKRALEELRRSEERFREMAENIREVFWLFDWAEQKTIYVSPAYEAIWGRSIEDLYDRYSEWAESIHPDDLAHAQESFVEIAHTGGGQIREYRIIRPDGSIRWISDRGFAVKDEKGQIVRIAGIAEDITDRKQLETQLQQIRKMEAIGTLAGGIAHDFNNLLMAVQGNVSYLLYDMDPTHPHYKSLKNIEKQVRSGAKLTSQILGYARKGKHEIKPIDLNGLVEEISETFSRTRKDITIERQLAQDLYPIEGDQSQIEQILLNLYANAADAMPSGGNLVLKTMNATHKDFKGKQYDPKPGAYVLLAVTDNGTGMDEKTKERIFEPFFTTKELGRGTGLGLASVYGVVKGHGGYIDVESRKNLGTTFSVYLPSSKKRTYRSIKETELAFRGNEMILLVDDEEMVLEIAAQLLRKLGYGVLEAGGGREAVDIFMQRKQEIDLVILDMVMPGMGAGDVYDHIKDIDPDVKVLLSSGYNMDGQASEILARGCDGFIQKPYSINELSKKLRDILSKSSRLSLDPLATVEATQYPC